MNCKISSISRHTHAHCHFFIVKSYLIFGPVVELARISVFTLSTRSKMVATTLVDVSVGARKTVSTSIPTIVEPAVRCIRRLLGFHPQTISAEGYKYVAVKKNQQVDKCRATHLTDTRPSSSSCCSSLLVCILGPSRFETDDLELLRLRWRLRLPDLDSCTSLHSLDPFEDDDRDLILCFGPRRLLTELPPAATSGSELSSRISPLSALLPLLLDLVRDRPDPRLLPRPPLRSELSSRLWWRRFPFSLRIFLSRDRSLEEDLVRLLSSLFDPLGTGDSRETLLRSFLGSVLVG